MPRAGRSSCPASSPLHCLAPIPPLVGSQQPPRRAPAANPNLKPQVDQVERPACLLARPGAPGLVRDLAHLPAINRHGRSALLLDPPPPPPDASRLAAKAHPGAFASFSPAGVMGGRWGREGWRRLPVRRRGRARAR